MYTELQFLSSSSGRLASTPERSRADSATGRSSQRSASGSRYSARLCRVGSAYDEERSRDELERKQRIVRYMQEERERSERSKLLRLEQDVWVELCAHERAERLRFMTEQEIALFLSNSSASVEQPEQDAVHTSSEACWLNGQRDEQDATKLSVPARSRTTAADQTVQGDRAQSIAWNNSDEHVSTTHHARLVTKCVHDVLDSATPDHLCTNNNRHNDDDDNNQRQQTAAMLETIQSLHTQMDGLRRDLDNVDRVKEQLESTLQSRNTTVHELEEELHRHRSRLETVNRRCNELQSVVARLEDEKRTHASALRQAREEEQQRSSSRVTQRKAELAELRRELKELHVQLAEQQRTTAEWGHRVSATSQENRKLQAELTAERARRERPERVSYAGRPNGTCAGTQASTSASTLMYDAAYNNNDDRIDDKNGRGSENAAEHPARVAELEREMAEMRAGESQLRNQLQAIQARLCDTTNALSRETAARVKFEELAAQAVESSDQVSREVWGRTQAALTACRGELARVKCKAAEEQSRAQSDLEAARREVLQLKRQQQQQGQSRLLRHEQQQHSDMSDEANKQESASGRVLVFDAKLLDGQRASPVRSGSEKKSTHLGQSAAPDESKSTSRVSSRGMRSAVISAPPNVDLTRKLQQEIATLKQQLRSSAARESVLSTALNKRRTTMNPSRKTVVTSVKCGAKSGTKATNRTRATTTSRATGIGKAAISGTGDMENATAVKVVETATELEVATPKAVADIPKPTPIRIQARSLPWADCVPPLPNIMENSQKHVVEPSTHPDEHTVAEARQMGAMPSTAAFVAMSTSNMDGIASHQDAASDELTFLLEHSTPNNSSRSSHPANSGEIVFSEEHNEVAELRTAQSHNSFLEAIDNLSATAATREKEGDLVPCELTSHTAEAAMPVLLAGQIRRQEITRTDKAKGRRMCC